MTNTSFTPAPVTLEGDSVRIEPLSEVHAQDLLAAGADPRIWTYMPRLEPFTSVDDVRRWIAEAEKDQRTGTSVPFAIVHRETGSAVGSTRFLDIDRANRSLEIGWTWLSPEVWRTAVNTETKYILLRHLFEDLGALRVFFKADSRNERSRRAIVRLGATEEGTFRRHRILADGFIRDSVYFSIVDSDWPKVGPELRRRLGRT